LDTFYLSRNIQLVESLVINRAIKPFDSSTTMPDGNATLIRADPRPVRVAPEDPGGMEVPHRDKLVYDLIAGEEGREAHVERLLPRPEAPLPVPGAPKKSLAEEESLPEEPKMSSPPSAAKGEYLVQLAAVRSRGGAEREWRRLWIRHPDLLGGFDPLIVAADGGEATMYRLRAGPLADAVAARRLCATLAKRGERCVAIRP